MSVDERWKLLKRKTCFSCLKRSKGHTATNCLGKKECQEKQQDGNLRKKTHQLLDKDGTTARAHVTCVQDDSRIPLPTVIGKVKKPNNDIPPANIFYDSGAVE